RRAVQLVFLDKMLRPTDLSGHAIETEQIAHGAKRVDAILVNQRCGARTTRKRDGVGTIVFVLPEDLAALGTGAQYAFVAGTAAARGPGGLPGAVQSPLAVHDVDAPVGDRWAAVAGAHRRPPEDFGTAGRKPGKQACLPPDTVTLGPEPLRPVECTRR